MEHVAWYQGLAPMLLGLWVTLIGFQRIAPPTRWVEKGWMGRGYLRFYRACGLLLVAIGIGISFRQGALKLILEANG